MRNLPVEDVALRTKKSTRQSQQTVADLFARDYLGQMSLEVFSTKA
jgi:hypothetical protein